MIDIQILPKKAQNELIDYYHFLVERYVIKKDKSTKRAITTNQLDSFFDQFSLEMKDLKFNREEIYER
jgi:predicted ATPase